MMTAYERSDIIHIMKMNRFTLSDSDTAHLEFGGQVKGQSYQIRILVVEDLPRIFIERNGEYVYNDTLKSIDDLKIFLEERFYKYFEAQFSVQPHKLILTFTFSNRLVCFSGKRELRFLTRTGQKD